MIKLPLKSHLFDCILLILMTVFMLSSLFIVQRLYPRIQNVIPGLIVEPVNCAIESGPCSVRFGGTEVSLSVEGKSIRSYHPLVFKIDMAGTSVDSIAIEFEGVDMFMGINRLVLEEESTGRFSGILGLPGHSYPMLWRARVLLENDGAVIEVRFDFELE